MAQSTVNTPFGPITVNHPDDAAEADILRFAELQANAREDRRRAVVAERPEEFDPSNERFRERFGAADPSAAENFRAGFGKGVTDLGRGLLQIAVEGANVIPGVDTSEQVSGLRENQRFVRQRDADLLDTKAGLGGTIAGVAAPTIATTALGGAGLTAAGLPRAGAAVSSIGAPTSFPTAAGSGAIQGALAPVTESESRLANTALGTAGGLIGQGIGSGLSRLAQPVSRNLSQGQDDAVSLLTREGVDLDVAQRTGSNIGGTLRRALQDNPVTSGGQRNFAERQAKQFTRAVLRTVGQDSDEVSPTVLNKAFSEISDTFDDAAGANPALFDPQLADDVAGILQRAPREVGDQGVVSALQANVDDIFDAAAGNRGAIPGARLTSIRGSLSSLSKKTPLARELEDALIEALDRSGGDSAALRQAVARYRNIRMIENSVDRGVDRFISPARLSNTVSQQRNRALSLRGLGHPESVRLSNLAAAGRTILGETIGNSGTASRGLGAATLAGGGVGVGAAALGADLGSAGLIGLGVAGAPLGAQRALLSQGGTGRFLAEGLQNPILRNLLQSRALNIASGQGTIQGALAGAR